jgi:DNA invertase Pin-like site-specific DNA recombinase
MLTHGIMASIAEFYSLNLAMEVTKGLRTKATTGGTINKAPIGYLNVETRTETGYELRTVALDPERAPLIKWAFESYATGEWTLSSLLEELTMRGLTSAPTPKRPAKPVHLSTLARTLQNPYYKGTIIYDGAPYDGLHEPLVSVDVWTQVQAVLRSNYLAGDRTQVHDHYLKGSVFCASCESRLTITYAKNRHGSIYPYFVCAGRHSKRTDCQRKAMHVYQVEDLIVQHYSRVQISTEVREALDAAISEEFAILNAQAKYETRDLAKQKNDLLNERAKLMQAHYAGAVPLDQLKEEQDRIATTLAQVTYRLDAASASYAEAQEELADCLDLASDCYSVYQQAPDAVRRLFNQAFFERIYITDDGDVRPEIAQPFASLTERASDVMAVAQEKRAGNAQTPDRTLSAEGLNFLRRVDAGGLKPNTWQRFERLGSAWEQAKLDVGDEPQGAIEAEPGVVTTPRRRTRTPLTDSQVDSIRTARANGESVVSISRRFGVHRMTVWTHTKRP